MLRADGDILKVLFSDDIILTKNLTEELDRAFTKGVKWAVTGFAHTIDDGRSHYNPKFPVYNDRLLEGVNTLSSPSILAVRKDLEEYFADILASEIRGYELGSSAYSILSYKSAFVELPQAERLVSSSFFDQPFIVNEGLDFGEIEFSTVRPFISTKTQSNEFDLHCVKRPA